VRPEECIRLARRIVDFRTSRANRHTARAIYERLHAEQVFAFGSAARGDAHAASDLDVLAIGPFTGSRTERALKVLDLAWELGFRRGVDAILLTPAELDVARAHPDFASILEEARLVPAAGG
jgi:predicted nucleotidyltransferase